MDIVTIFMELKILQLNRTDKTDKCHQLKYNFKNLKSKLGILASSSGHTS